MGTKGTTMEIFKLKQPHGANKYSQHMAVYSKYTAVYSGVYGRILRYWSIEYAAVYPKSPKWGSFKHNIDQYNWLTRGIPQLTYACIVHCTLVAMCTCHIPLSPKNPLCHPYTPRYSSDAGLCSPYSKALPAAVKQVAVHPPSSVAYIARVPDKVPTTALSKEQIDCRSRCMEESPPKSVK